MSGRDETRRGTDESLHPDELKREGVIGDGARAMLELARRMDKLMLNWTQTERPRED